MARHEILTRTRRVRALNNAEIDLSSSDSPILKAETRRRYAEHVAACQKFGVQPSSKEWFYRQLAEEFRRGTYTRPEKLQPEHEPNCQRLLFEVFTVTEQRRRLRAWHAQYVRACQEQGLRAYTLHLILDTFNDHDVRVPGPVSLQAARINQIVADYVVRAKRKENPQWYARPLKTVDKTDKYAE